MLVRGGSYGAQQITGSRSSSNTITFKAASGETPQIFGKFLIGAGGTVVGPDYVTIDGIVMAQVGAGYEAPDNR